MNPAQMNQPNPAPVCPECHFGPNTSYGMHIKTCSLIDVASALKYMSMSDHWADLYSKRITTFVKLSQQWEGKFRIVKHENNQLRKKLYPNK